MKVSTTFSSLLFLALFALNTLTHGQQPGPDHSDTTTGAGIDVLACWDFSGLSPASTLADGERVEDSCNDHDARVRDGLEVVDGVIPGTGALTFSSSSVDALVFEPGHDFGDSGPVAGPEFDFLSGDGITLEALIRVPESFTGFGSIVSKDVGPGQASWWFRINNGRLQGFVGDGDIQQLVTGDRLINDGQWHHVALVRQAGNSLSLYVDYELDASVAIPVLGDIATPAGTPITIGDFNYAARRLEGDIQTVRIARAALSPSQFQWFDQAADLNVAIDHDGQSLVPGLTTSFEITFSNAGPASVMDVAVEALLPNWIDSATWTCTPDSGASCSASGTGDLVDQVDLPANHSVVYTLDADLAVDGSGEDELAASIDPGDYVDFNLVNNHASIPIQFVGSHELVCWDFSDRIPGATLSDGDRVEDACGDRDARVLGQLEVIDGLIPGGGALAFSASSSDALAFEPGYDFGDAGPIAGTEFDFAGDDSFTLEAIVRIPESFTGFGSIMAKDVGPGQPSWWFRVHNGQLQALISDGSSQSIAGSETINDGGWHHVALVRDADSNTLNLYVDYQLDQSEPTAAMGDIATPDNTPITLGAFNSGAHRLQGDMQMARITREALPASAFLLYDQGAILRVSMDHDGEPLTPEGVTQYIITISNAGPMPTTGVGVDAPMPVGFSAATWSCVADGGASCASGGTGDISDTVDLPTDASVVYTVSVDLDEVLPNQVTYTATISPDGVIAFGDKFASVTTPRAGLGRIHVRQSAPSGGDGRSWENAYDNLQDALAEARTLTAFTDISIWVARGVYYPDQGASQAAGSRLSAFTLGNNIAIYGGFAGSENELSDRDWVANPTVLSGDIDGNDTVNASGIAEHYNDIVGNNSYHVVRAFETDGSAILDGFVITGGLANAGGLVHGLYLMRHGGGLYLHSSHPTLNNLVIQGNRANEQGGGIYLYRDSGNNLPTLHMTDIILRGNGAIRGGGMSSDRTRFLLDNCRVEDNNAEYGGGLYGWLVVFEINNCRIAGNQATHADGGGLRTFRGRGAIVNTRISGNRAAGDGGGMWIDPNVLALNYVLTNVTFSGNHADGDGGAIYHYREDWGTNFLNNAIIWNNSDSSGTGTPGSSHGGPGAARLQASYSLVQGLNPSGTGNLDGTEPGNDPLFISPLNPEDAPGSSGNFRVDLDSPTLDRGNNQARISVIIGTSVPHIPIEGNILFDLDGNERIVDGVGDGIDQIDLGPYESLGVQGRWIGGEVSGLAGTGLVLQNNGGDNLAIVANGGFTFATALSVGSSYEVTVLTQPASLSQTCTVGNGAGTLDGADVNDVEVSCATNTFSVGGTVSGLSGSGLVLRNNDGDDLPIAADGSFAFPPQTDGSSYSVIVQTQPTNPGQACTVGNGAGALDGADVTDVEVSCTTNTFSVGGTVSGLVGSGLTLHNNGTDDLPIVADGEFTFAAAVIDGNAYEVTVLNQPANPLQICAVSNASGVIDGADVTDVEVHCVTELFTIGGTASGLTGPGLVLRNNGGDDLPIAANGGFEFDTPQHSDTPYNVTVASQPDNPLQFCMVSGGQGVVGDVHVSDIEVDCTDRPDSVFSDRYEN